MWRRALPKRGPVGPLFVRRRIGFGVLLLLFGCAPSEQGLETQSGPDFLFLNGKVLTVDEGFSIAMDQKVRKAPAHR